MLEIGCGIFKLIVLEKMVVLLWRWLVVLLCCLFCFVMVGVRVVFYFSGFIFFLLNIKLVFIKLMRKVYLCMYYI